MARRAPFPPSRMPASVESSIKLFVCLSDAVQDVEGSTSDKSKARDVTLALALNAAQVCRNESIESCLSSTDFSFWLDSDIQLL